MKEVFFETLLSYWHFIKALTPKLVIALGTMLFFILVANLIQQFYERTLRSRRKYTIITGFISALLKSIILLFGIAMALKVLGLESVSSTLFAGAGISAIVFGFAFKDIAENFLAGIILAIKRPFKIRDIIEVGGFKGKVREMDLRTTHIRVDDGRDIFIPNSMIIKNVFTNYTTDGLLQRSFFISIAVNDDIGKAIQIIKAIVDNQDDILKHPMREVNIAESSSMAYKLKINFWQDIFKTKPIENEIGDHTTSRLHRLIVKELSEQGFILPK